MICVKKVLAVPSLAESSQRHRFCEYAAILTNGVVVAISRGATLLECHGRILVPVLQNSDVSDRNPSVGAASFSSLGFGLCGGPLKTEIGAAADSHQREQRSIELRHGQLLEDAENEDHSENQRPCHHLKAMKVHAAPLS